MPPLLLTSSNWCGWVELWSCYADTAASAACQDGVGPSRCTDGPTLAAALLHPIQVNSSNASARRVAP